MKSYRAHWDFGQPHAEELSPINRLLPLPLLNLSAEDLTNCPQQGKE